MYKTAKAGFTKRKRANHREILGSWLLLPFPRHNRRGAVFDCLFDLNHDVFVTFSADFCVVSTLYYILYCPDCQFIHHIFTTVGPVMDRVLSGLGVSPAFSQKLLYSRPRAADRFRA